MCSSDLSLPPRVAAVARSFSVYRALKGMVILLCELFAILLTFFEPIASIPYYLGYFVVIAVPDYIMWLFFEFKIETKSSVSEITTQIDQAPSLTETSAATSKYISQKLLYPDVDTFNS